MIDVEGGEYRHSQVAIPRLPGELLKKHISSSERLIRQKEHGQDSKDHCHIAQGPQGETPGLGSQAQPKGAVLCLLILGKPLSHSARYKELTGSLSRVNKHLRNVYNSAR